MRLKEILLIVFGLPKTIFFNFYYLPFKKAVKLPILLSRAKFLRLSGEVVIDCENIKTGMIKLGLYDVSIYQNLRGIVFENYGGKIIFNGKCDIGSGSAISIGEQATIDFGKNFRSTNRLRIASFVGIKFGDNVLFAWDNTVIDTDFHALKNKFTNTKIEGKGYISIGNNNWIGTGCTILKNTVTPNYCVSASKSLLNRNYFQYGEKVTIGGIPATIISDKHYWDIDDDKIAHSASKE